MPKVTSPFFSIGASGTFAGQVNYRRTKKGTIARIHSQPTGAPSSKQLSIRALTKQVAKHWLTVSPSNKLSWHHFAILNSYSTFNAFFVFNFARVKADLPILDACPGYASPVTQILLNYGPDDWTPTEADLFSWTDGTIIQNFIGISSEQCIYSSEIFPVADHTLKAKFHFTNIGDTDPGNNPGIFLNADVGAEVSINGIGLFECDVTGDSSYIPSTSTDLWLKLSFFSSENLYRVKFWNDGTEEPALYQLTGTPYFAPSPDKLFIFGQSETDQTQATISNLLFTTP